MLIGDAAHAALPSAGQGASQALVDAATLAELLPCTRAELDAVFTELTRQRRRETSALIERARRDAAIVAAEWTVS